MTTLQENKVLSFLVTMVRMSAIWSKRKQESQVMVHIIKFPKITTFKMMVKVTVNRKGKRLTRTGLDHKYLS